MIKNHGITEPDSVIPKAVKNQRDGEIDNEKI